MSAVLPSLKTVLTRYDLKAKKSLGQNFILDDNILAEIISHVGSVTEGTTIEVGPGPGGLTRAIIAAGAKDIIVIEKDNRFISALTNLKTQTCARLTILNTDALSTDLSAMGNEPRRIISNLPYNISTILLTQWLQNISAFSSLTLMFQKEVAERLTASPGTHAYGRLSVVTSAFANAGIKMILPPEIFTPIPKVSSALVHITPKKAPSVTFKELAYVTGIAFSMRRKMLRTSLKPLGDVQKICEYAGIKDTMRAENVTIEQFIKIAELLKDNQDGYYSYSPN